MCFSFHTRPDLQCWRDSIIFSFSAIIYRYRCCKCVTSSPVSFPYSLPTSRYRGATKAINHSHGLHSYKQLTAISLFFSSIVYFSNLRNSIQVVSHPKHNSVPCNPFSHFPQSQFISTKMCANSPFQARYTRK